MSYRTFKHLLGETSLERKCRFIFGGGILALVTLSFWLYGQKTESLVIEQGTQAARMQVKQVVQNLHYKAWVNKDFAPVIDGLSRGLSVQDDAQEYEFHVVVPYSKDPAKQPRDDFERWALAQFLQASTAEVEAFAAGTLRQGNNFVDGTPREVSRVVPGKTQYQYARAILFQPNCMMKCHAVERGALDTKHVGPSQELGEDRIAVADAAVRLEGLGDVFNHLMRESDSEKFVTVKPGDLAAAVVVTFSMERTNKDINRNRAFLIATALVTAIVAMGASWTIVRYVIIKPVKHLRDVSDAIAAGKLTVRSQIQTGDEFEELSHAFNRMLHNLVAMQQELRDVNADLDRKVDELAQANMALFEMNRLKSDFLATMSHELRTPLNSIIGFSEVLADSDQLTDRQRRYAANIQNSGKMLLGMINDILDLAKIESGKMEVKPEDFSIRDVCEGLANLMRPLAERKNIDLECRLDEAIPLLRQDPSKLRQIIYNLLSNALKFTPEGGRVALRARAEGRFVVLAVADTGIGISEEDREAIFEKFRQVRQTGPGGDVLTREHQGTGLGLSIVRELSKLLGGDVTLESRPGQGSTFTVRVPMQLPGNWNFEVNLTDDRVDLSKARRVEPRLPLPHHRASPLAEGLHAWRLGPGTEPSRPDGRSR